MRSFYQGLCAQSYDLFITDDVLNDLEFFRSAIAAAGEPALEVGCGTGRLLLKYLQEGLDVEGVDLSRDMLAVCRRKAKEMGLGVTLYEQPMQLLDLARSFQTIFVPAFSFMLLTEPREVTSALRNFFRHLNTGGTLIVPLLLPWKEDAGVEVAPPDTWRLRREGVRATDGATVQCWEKATYDFVNHLKHVTCRYEILEAGASLGDGGVFLLAALV